MRSGSLRQIPPMDGYTLMHNAISMSEAQELAAQWSVNYFAVLWVCEKNIVKNDRSQKDILTRDKATTKNKTSHFKILFYPRNRVNLPSMWP